ncbi:MAG: PilN domain-containing protein [Pseudomonadota bacterium]
MTDVMTHSPDRDLNGRGVVRQLRRLRLLLDATFEQMAQEVRPVSIMAEAEVMLDAKGWHVTAEDQTAGPFTASEAVDVLREVDLRDIDLVLQDRAVLDLSFELPSAPLAELRAMVEAEIAFHSPFDPSQAVSIWAGEEQEDGLWSVQAAVLLKANVQPFLDAAEAGDVRIANVRREDADSHPLVEGLPIWADPSASPVTVGKGQASLLARIPKIMRPVIFAGGAFLVSFLGLSIVQGQVLSGLRAEADGLQGQMARTASLQAASRDFAVERAASAERISLVAELTALLPDDTWLDQFTIKGDELIIVGFGPSAAAVTELLSIQAGLTDVRYGSPVSRDNSQNLERFRIVATLGAAE